MQLLLGPQCEELCTKDSEVPQFYVVFFFQAHNAATVEAPFLITPSLALTMPTLLILLPSLALSHLVYLNW